MKKKFNYLLMVLVGLISTIVGIGSIEAATKYSYVGDVFYYNSSNIYTSSYSGYPGTYYKRLCDSSSGLSKSCGVEAFCIEKSKASPDSGDKYVSVDINGKIGSYTWTEERAIRTGEIINNVQKSSSIDTNAKKYVYTYMAINNYLQFSSNSFSNKYIDTIVANAKKMTICSNKLNNGLTAPSIKAEDDFMKFEEDKKGNGYFYSKFDLTLPLKDKCGTTIEYTISLPADSKAKMYSDSKFQNAVASGTKISGKSTYTIYLKVDEKDRDYASSYKITVKGGSSETYNVASLWKPINSSGSYLSSIQALVTYGPKTYTHSSSDSATVEVPNPEVKNFKISKLDENGSSLGGAEMKLTIAKKTDNTERTEIGSCEIKNGNSSCSYSFDNFDETAEYFYKVNETKAPDGYVIDKRFVGSDYTKIPFGQSGTKYFYSKGSKSVELTVNNAKEIYNNSGLYEVKSVCVDKDDANKIISVDKSESDCIGNPTTDTSNNNTSGSDGNGSTSSGDGNTSGNDGGTSGNGDSGSTGGNENVPTNKFITNACVIKNSDGSSYSFAPSLSDGATPCDTDVSFYKQVTNGRQFTLYIRNYKTIVSISKQNINGNEVDGAELKICSKIGDDGYDKKGNDCIPVSNVDKEELKWISEGQPKVWNGIPIGTYYLIEVTPPGGYIQATTAIEFTIKDDGTVVSKNLDKESGSIVIKNNLNEVIISKQDITDKKELPGAKLYICEASKDDNGKFKMVVDDGGICSPVSLADGTVAEWKSSKEPHKIHGLRPGSYYLVEDKAPLGYLDAESIVFTMKDDGTLTDENGRPIGQNKIVMYDSKNPKTGSIIIIIVASIMVIAGGIAYYFIKKRK